MINYEIIINYKIVLNFFELYKNRIETGDHIFILE